MTILLTHNKSNDPSVVNETTIVTIHVIETETVSVEIAAEITDEDEMETIT